MRKGASETCPRRPAHLARSAILTDDGFMRDHAERPTHIVVRDGDIFLRHRGDLPAPMLLDLCNDGKAHEAWPMAWPDGNVQWRARDDAWDVDHKPVDVAYRLVRAGLNPYRDRS